MPLVGLCSKLCHSRLYYPHDFGNLPAKYLRSMLISITCQSTLEGVFGMLIFDYFYGGISK